MNLFRPISVVLADDHAMVRESLARVLDECDDVSVLGQVGSGDQLRAAVDEHGPDCLIMDYSMPNHQPVDVIRRLLEGNNRLRILVLTVHENAHYAVRTLQAGAHGYLIKSAAVDELVNAIRTINEGDVYISKKISQEVWSLLRRPGPRRQGIESLSQRELEVLRILGAGSSLQDCAKQLGVSVSNVSTYRGRVLDKLNLASTSELVRFAIENRFVH